MKLLTLIVLLISIITRVLSNNSSESNDKSIVKSFNYRLPNTTLPRLYIINLEPHIDDVEFTFDGTSSTLFEVLRPTQDIIVHMSELIVIDKKYTKLVYNNGTILGPISQHWNSTLEFFTIHFNDELEMGNYTLKLKWKGHDDSEHVGIYRGIYQNEDDETNEIPVVATAFQAIAARSGYPCWDEPAFRVQFELSLKHYPNYTALSNMPVKRIETAEDGKIWTIFERSIPMPSYMLAFVIAPYTNLTNKHGNMSLWIPSAELKNAQLAFDLSHRVITFMEEYTGIPFAFPKMDQVMAPEYAAGAIEHWGLITYSSSILYNTESNDIEAKDYTMSLAAHEISHQWFGNLVTPAWWSDLWLSEGFATFFQYKILDKLIDNWNAMDFFNIMVLDYVAFPMNARNRKSHPLKSAVKTPRQIETMFDTITYIKGAGVLEMLENILSEEVFHKGIRKYLSRHQFSSVETDDLWHALQEVYSEEKISPELNIKEIMDPWVQQNGIPFINMTRDYETGYVTLTQRSSEKSTSTNLWMIPINYITSSKLNVSSTQPVQWMQRSNDSLILTDIPKDDWIIFNIQNKDFYRVDYDFENWRRVIEFLNSDNYHKIHVRNRSRLLLDFLCTVIMERNHLNLAIDMLSYLHREKDLLPWVALTKTLDSPIKSFANTPSHSIFSKWALYLMNNIINRVGFEKQVDDGYLDIQLREEITEWACIHGHEGCRAFFTSRLIEKLMDDSKKLISNPRSRKSYCMGLTRANETIWNLMMDKYFIDTESVFQYLGCTKNHTLIKKYLDLAFIKDKTLAAHYILDAFESLIDSIEQNFDFALDLFIENFPTIYENFRETNSTEKVDFMKKIITKFALGIKLDSQYEKFMPFVNEQIEKGKMNFSADDIMLKAKKSLTASATVLELVNSFMKQGKFSH